MENYTLIEVQNALCYLHQQLQFPSYIRLQDGNTRYIFRNPTHCRYRICINIWRSTTPWAVLRPRVALTCMLMKEICKLMGIQKTNTTAYHPQMDGLVERFNRTLIDMWKEEIGIPSCHMCSSHIVLVHKSRPRNHHSTCSMDEIHNCLQKKPYHHQPRELLWALTITRQK